MTLRGRLAFAALCLLVGLAGTYEQSVLHPDPAAESGTETR